ncbi:MAG: PHP domain-containing protein [Oscillospiraceae bacterium]|jgi:predicted metal-dependent phosphoesterase TrpH|nr:PHP domain-containing protein [Oscillospiraceae bacterium]
MAIDLHCHTKLSDGSTTIDDLIFISRRARINTIAVTDHDTFSGAKRAVVLGKRFGINVILGAEFSSYSVKFKKEIHILCYMCEFPDRLEGLCQINAQVRHDTILSVLQKVMKYFPISPEMVSAKARGSSNIFENHILQAVMDAGYTSTSYKAFSYKLLSDSYELSEIIARYPEPEKVISLIHAAEGIAILAHPSNEDETELLPDLVNYGIDGIEVFNPDIKSELREKLERFAKFNDLLVTGGSNFHGMYSLYPRPVGFSETNETDLMSLIERKTVIFQNIKC